MKIIIETPGFKPSNSLTGYVIEKVSKLEKLHHNIISAEVTMEVDVKKTKEVINCSIILNIPGKDEYVKASAFIFEDAVTKAVEAAKRRLRIRKTQRIQKRKE
ncbi:MAG: HPF/RaiA family ribosome-associated protein [Bacteroidia bacterium]|nr:HPF/RaiA family ribosome-associated protein [Bacteroidia bacterium]